MYFTYILYSKKFTRTYTGHTQDLGNRLKEHNSGKTKSTRPYVPWEIFYYEKFLKREEAILREKFFKSPSGRQFIKNNLFNK